MKKAFFNLAAFLLLALAVSCGNDDTVTNPTEEQFSTPLPGLRYLTDFSFSVGQSFHDQPRAIPMKGFCYLDNCYGANSQKRPNTAMFPGLIQAAVPSLGNIAGNHFPIPNRRYTWHAVYLIRNSAGEAEVRVMPFVRVFSDVNNVIRSATHRHSPPGVLPPLATIEESHNFPQNLLANAYLLVLSGNNRGIIRSIVSNTSETITYEGSNLRLSSDSSLPQDWIALTPPNVSLENFVYIGCILCGSVGDVINFYKAGEDYASYQDVPILSNQAIAQQGIGSPTWFYLAGHVPPTATHARVYVTFIGTDANLPTTAQLYVGTDGSNHIQALYTAGLTKDTPYWGISDTWLLATGAGSTVQQSVFLETTNTQVKFEIRVMGYSEKHTLELSKESNIGTQ